VDILDNIINLDDYRTDKEMAELIIYLAEVKSMIARQRQDKVLVALHYLLEIEKDYSFLSEREIIEIVNIFHSQVTDGITTS